MWRWLVIFCVAGTCARAAPLVLVADFDFIDSSGEARNQVVEHGGRIDALRADIIGKLERDGKLGAGVLKCGQPRCSADGLDQDLIAAAARAQHGTYVVFGGVHKISTLIQFGRVEVMDVSSGRSVLSRAITFRGDDQAAWQHAGDFIAQMLLDDLK